jgi:hypothetical protein
MESIVSPISFMNRMFVNPLERGSKVRVRSLVALTSTIFGSPICMDLNGFCVLYVSTKPIIRLMVGGSVCTGALGVRTVMPCPEVSGTRRGSAASVAEIAIARNDVKTTPYAPILEVIFVPEVLNSTKNLTPSLWR